MGCWWVDDELSSVSVFRNFRGPKYEEGDLLWLKQAIVNMKEALDEYRMKVEGRLDKALRPIALKASTNKSTGNKKNKNKKRH